MTCSGDYGKESARLSSQTESGFRWLADDEVVSPHFRPVDPSVLALPRALSV